MSEVILTILGAVLVYLFGRWQGEHQLLYQRRVQVIAELFDRFEDVERTFSALMAPLGGGDPEKGRQAAEGFNALQQYYRRNSIWLPLRVSKQVSGFLTQYREPFDEFTEEVMLQDFQEGPQGGRIRTWNDVWTAFRKDSPEIRQALETEFRAALGSYRAKLAILLEYIPTTHQDQKSPSEINRP
jgi:hypothetical protein